MPIRSTHHGPPENDIPGLQDQAVVIPHEAPREYRPAIEIPDLTQSFDELDRLDFVVKDELATTNAALDVIDRFRN